jgi:peptide/nickel transport system permease protein
MQRYILRRFVFLAFVIVGVTLVLFVIMYLLPGDPARAAAGPGAGPEQVEVVRQKMGLDKPPYVQYLTYMRNLLHGDLGVSIATRKQVSAELATYLPGTLELVLAAMFLNILIAIPLGVFSGLQPGKVADTLSRLFAALGMGMPVFWVALMAEFLFYGKLGLLPFGGRLSPTIVAPDRVTGLYLIDSLLAGNLPVFKDALVHLIMPAVVMALPEIAATSRLIRSSMLDVFCQDYIRTARAKGLPERRVIWIHALKNALLVPLTVIGMQVGWMMGGTLLVESVFSWPGLGFLAFNGIYKRDFPIIMGVTLLMCVVFVLSNLVVDVLYSYLDPRITY